MKAVRRILALAVVFASCTKGVDPEECRNEFNKILDTYQNSCTSAAARFVTNPVPSHNNHDSLVVAVNAAVDVANAAAAAPRLSECSGWNKLPHIQ